ncbi:MAG: Snf7 family protein [Candidatus Helarchaeota archaeon]
MGAFEKFVKWLKGGNNLNKIIINIDIFTRSLARQRKELEKQARDNFRMAKKYRLEGNNQAARMYMEHRVRFQKWALGVDSYRLHIVGLLQKLKQAQAHNEMAKTLIQINRVLGSLKQNVQIPRLSDLMASIDQTFNQFDLAGEFIDEGMEQMVVNTEVTDTDINQGMAELDAEIGMETGQVLTSPSSGRISKLEEEIRKLKEGR